MKTSLIILTSFFIMNFCKAQDWETSDSINYKLTTQSGKVINASIIETGGIKSVTIEGICSYQVNSKGQIGHAQLINDPTPDGCIGNAINACNRDWWCSVICDHGLAIGCILGWLGGCLAGVNMN